MHPINIVERFAPSLNTELGLLGGLFAVALPAGTYSIAGWYVSQDDTTFTPKGPVKVEFDVLAGQATYLGNLHFVEVNRANPFKIGYSVTLEDMRDRDIPILVKHYATLATSHVNMAMSPGAKLANMGSPSHQGLTILLRPPPEEVQ